MIKYECNECKKKYDIDQNIIRCTCGGMLNIEKREFDFSIKDINIDEWNIFRYIKTMPFEKNFEIYKDITMGEGMTAIVPYDSENLNLMVKMDYMMPTLSFKDRGAAVLIAKAKEMNIKKVIQDSSGNAGNAIAAYAKRANIKCEIYVPKGTSQKKINQISSHDAEVHIVNGNRDDTAKTALKAVLNGDGFYASHVYNPFFYEGTKTYIYEVYEQLDGEIPENIVTPVGNGTLLLGIYYGLKEMLELKLIDKLPKIIAVQADKCSPIYNAFINKDELVTAITAETTQAEGIAIGNPMRGKQILNAIKDTNGVVIVASEDKIANARVELAHRGFYVEPTTAATFAGYFEYIKKNKLNGKVLIPLCGSGLKSDK